MNESTFTIDQSAPLRQEGPRVIRYPLRDVASLNTLSEFCRRAPGVTLGGLNRAQDEAARRLGAAYV